MINKLYMVMINKLYVTRFAKTRHRKPDIMAHTKIFSTKQYKNSVQKTHFIKYFKRTYKGHNLATLTRISKT